MGKGDVDARKRNEARKFLLLVVVDSLAIFKDTSHCLDKWDQLVEVLSELCDVDNVEDDIELGLLGQATPMDNDQRCTSSNTDDSHKISPWMLLRSRGGAGVSQDGADMINVLMSPAFHSPFIRAMYSMACTDGGYQELIGCRQIQNLSDPPFCVGNGK
jgi:hypothetical protein